jgi:NADH:ubiquinone oxidoreductase subunit K
MVRNIGFNKWGHVSEMLSIPLTMAQGLAAITLAVVMSWVALGAAIIYFYYRERKKVTVQQT